MIGSGLKKLAQQYGMTVSSGVAYGDLKGFATTLCEGSGYKRIDISTRFGEYSQQEALQAAIHGVDMKWEYRVQGFELAQRRITVVFHDTVGTMKKIEAFIEWFYPLLSQHGAWGTNICPECGTQVSDGGWYLIDGAAHHMHEACGQRITQSIQEEDQQRRDEDTGSYGMGILGAFAGALLGSIVWAVVLYMGYVASLVGLLIGWLAEKGYTLLRGKQGKGKIVILILAIIFGVLLGTIIPDVVVLAQMIGGGELPGIAYGDIPMLIVMLLAEDAEYMSATLSNVGMGLLFAALGVFALLRKAKKEVSGVSVKKLN